MNTCLILVPYNLQKLQSWIIYKVYVHLYFMNTDQQSGKFKFILFQMFQGKND